MEDLTIIMIGLAAVLIAVTLALRALTLHYHFSRKELTVSTFGFLIIGRIRFAEATLETVGYRRTELSRLKERLPARKVHNLTRSILSRWLPCGFIITPSAIHIVPALLARAIISRNPPARWRLLKAARRRQIARLPRRLIEAWPAWLTIGDPTCAALLVILPLIQIGYAAGAIHLLYQDLRPLPLAPHELKRAITLLAAHQSLQPVLSLLLGVSLLVLALARKRLPSLLVFLVLIASVAGIPLCASGNTHDMSHLVGDTCSSYPDTQRLFLSISIALCCVILSRPWLQRLLKPDAVKKPRRRLRPGRPSSAEGSTHSERPSYHSSPRP